MDTRLFPVNRNFVNYYIRSLITHYYSNAGRPATIDAYPVFYAMIYALGTGISWRDLPKCYGNRNHMYQRFKHRPDRGVWWNILRQLQYGKHIKTNIVMIDSTTFKIHRHGGGFKGLHVIGVASASYGCARFSRVVNEGKQLAESMYKNIILDQYKPTLQNRLLQKLGLSR